MNFEADLMRFCEEKKFSGVVTINKSGKSVLSKAFGYRDLSNRLLNNADTIFGIASGTKTFTASGIIKMIEQGSFDYSTPGERFSYSNGGYIHKMLDENRAGIRGIK